MDDDKSWRGKEEKKNNWWKGKDERWETDKKWLSKEIKTGN